MRTDSVHMRTDSVHNNEIPDNEWDELFKSAEPIRKIDAYHPNKLKLPS